MSSLKSPLIVFSKAGFCVQVVAEPLRSPLALKSTALEMAMEQSLGVGMRLVARCEAQAPTKNVSSVKNYQAWYKIFSKLGVRVQRRGRHEKEHEGGVLVVYSALVRICGSPRSYFTIWSDASPDEESVRSKLSYYGEYTLP